MSQTGSERFKRYEPIFGSWYITGEIGSGAEGFLYRIERTDSLGNVFYSALKAIAIPLGGEAELESLMAGGVTREEAKKYYENVLENTTHEFELLARLKGNSYIVSYEDHEIFEHEDGFGWDILIRLEELVPLIRHSIGHPLSEDDVISMGADICRGLELCRKYGIVHRDIKPDNIFISPSGNYKLGDFGIARIIRQSTDLALSRKGTYAYMAPEVYWGREYDHTVDIYSLGLVMYRYLNDGRMPFQPSFPEELRYDSGEDAFIRRINGQQMAAPRLGSDRLRRIVLKACAYSREDRYHDASEMLRDLEALQNGSAEESGYIPSGQKTAKYNKQPDPARDRKRSKALKIAAAVLAAGLLTAGIAYSMVPKEVTDIVATDIEGGAEIYVGDSLVPSYTIEPSGLKDEKISFSSGDESVFTVDGKGKINALSVGHAALTMTAGEYSEDVIITVIPKVTSIEGIDETIELAAGDSLELEPRLQPEKFASEPVTYSVGDEEIASVSDSGAVTGVSAGETTLEISAGGCSVSRKIVVFEPVIYSPGGGSSGSSSVSSSGSSSGSYSEPSPEPSPEPASESSEGEEGYFSSGDDEFF